MNRRYQTYYLPCFGSIINHRLENVDVSATALTLSFAENRKQDLLNSKSKDIYKYLSEDFICVCNQMLFRLVSRWRSISFLSPLVQFAQWAQMRRFLSVPTGPKIIIHISESIRARIVKVDDWAGAEDKCCYRVGSLPKSSCIFNVFQY